MSDAATQIDPANRPVNAFFSTTIPVILFTRIPLSVPRMVLIWFERTFLAVPIARPVAP